MLKDKKQKETPYRMRINLKEQYEVLVWTIKFNCTKKELQKAVKRVGDAADKVEKFLTGRMSGSHS
ncbi:MAG: hypothetical protein K0S44_2157 [Bacteroidetes bacterium]|jgi:hypothetical protein|nr:hypothetical protein [Bacteroidota bacterium]